MCRGFIGWKTTRTPQKLCRPGKRRNSSAAPLASLVFYFYLPSKLGILTHFRPWPFFKKTFILTIPLRQKCFSCMIRHQKKRWNQDLGCFQIFFRRWWGAFFHSQPLFSWLGNINNSWPTCVTDRLQASPLNCHHYHYYSQRILFTILQFATHVTEVWFRSVVQG